MPSIFYYWGSGKYSSHIRAKRAKWTRKRRCKSSVSDILMFDVFVPLRQSTQGFKILQDRHLLYINSLTGCVPNYIIVYVFYYHYCLIRSNMAKRSYWKLDGQRQTYCQTVSVCWKHIQLTVRWFIFEVVVATICDSGSDSFQRQLTRPWGQAALVMSAGGTAVVPSRVERVVQQFSLRCTQDVWKKIMVFSGHDLLIGNFTIIGLFAGMFQAIFQGLFQKEVGWS